MEDIDIIGPKIQEYKLQFILNVDFWANYNRELIKLEDLEWKEVKFLDDLGTDMSSEMEGLPSDSGGIYFFYVKSNIIPGNGYLVYIGRAFYTDSQNLKKRCRSYYQKYFNERPKIRRMIRKWGIHLHLRYICLKDNELIEKLEEELINAIIPPLNDKIPNKIIRDAVKAFS
ncbi:hypothetical protein [Sutcliffiella cohnii]|uniref:hypothetical protein n=1 Tax=Sutcliffiella cohnii TaxID=33932 RepID=UPI002E1A6BF4|nr:hypothetical protein [Sutcliffiella cohnii]